jgi:hypothetical protein
MFFTLFFPLGLSPSLQLFRYLSRLQQAAPAFFASKITIQIMVLTGFQLGGTVVAG